MQGFRRRFPLNSVLVAVLGFLVGLLANAISVYLSDPFWLGIVIALAALVFALYIIDTLRRPPDVTVRFGAPITLQPEDADRYARQGLVVFVSKYSPARGGAGAMLSAEARLEAARNLDYASLDLLNSNLETTIHAITSHRARLKHCWLIGTSASEDDPGSSVYIPVIKEYLRRELKFDCIFHDGREYQVSVKNDEQIYTKTYDLLRTIFREAQVLRLGDDEIVVDFTAGIRSMGLGAVLASLDGKHDIEFVGVHYDAAGQIVPHDLFTMIFNFEPVMPKQ